MFWSECPKHGKFLDEAMGCPACWKEIDEFQKFQKANTQFLRDNPNHFANDPDIDSPKRRKKDVK
jgi:hypothetical protein